MYKNSMLEFSLREILHVIRPSRKDWEMRMQIIEDLRVAVCNIDGLRGATVEPFGSFVSHLFTRWGDVDVFIQLHNGPYIAVAARNHKQTLLREVYKALQKTGRFCRFQCIAHARVPILKLQSIYHENISCDISINNLLGQMKSKFLYWINLIDQRFGDMVLLVKELVKANSLNSAKDGSFNSYSLSLLVIFHLQTCVPPILPPIKDLFSGNMADELTGIRADVERRIEKVAFNNIVQFRRKRKFNRSSLSELFTSFLAKFSSINTMAAAQGISTHNGRWEDINTTTRWLPKTYVIYIEDPFEIPTNTARTVKIDNLNKIARVFSNTYHRIIAPYQIRNTLIPLLVRHDISYLFPVMARSRPFSMTYQRNRSGQPAKPVLKKF